MDQADALDEAALLARIAGGDRDAFRALYARYSGPLFSLAMRMVGDRGEAEELLQDAFMKLWRNAGTYDARKSQPFTWAVTIMRRTCIDWLRKRRRAPLMASLDLETSFVPRSTDSPSRSATANDDAERVRQALSALPATQRGAIELALFSSLTHAEIAETLHQPIGTVKSWIRRGLVDLRASLNPSAS